MIEVAGAGNRRAAGNVADELEIRNVLTRIAHCSDTGELADYAALFTEDARWEMPGVPVKQSRAEIRSAGAVRRAEGATGPGSHTRHLIGTIAVTVAPRRPGRCAGIVSTWGATWRRGLIPPW